MLVEIEQQGDICFARFSGRLSAGAELEYLGKKGDEIKKLEIAKLLADFSQVHSVGSTGIGFVVGLFTWATKKQGGRFVLVGVRPRVKEVLDLTRLSTILPIRKDVETGLAYLNGHDTAAHG